MASAIAISALLLAVLSSSSSSSRSSTIWIRGQEYYPDDDDDNNNNNNYNDEGGSSGGYAVGGEEEDGYHHNNGGDSYYNHNNNNNNDYYGSGGGSDYLDSSYSQSQQAPDPSQADSLYADYAARQEMKESGSGGSGGGSGSGYHLGHVLLGGSVSYWLGAHVHSRRAVMKVKTKFQKEQKALYAQYYNDVYKLSEQNAELNAVVEKLYDRLTSTQEAHEMEAVQRDYEEFKQPDLDGDDRISRTEFNSYVKNYLANYPGMEVADYPKFEDFDHDGDGYVSFKEYAKQMAIQTQEAERKQTKTEEAERKQKLAAQQALKSLYK